MDFLIFVAGIIFVGFVLEGLLPFLDYLVG